MVARTMRNSHHYTHRVADILSLLFATLTGVGTAAHAVSLPDVTSARLLAGTEASEWLTYGGNYANWRYSGLTDINRGNVAKLVPVWMLQTGVQGQVAASPVVADGVLYFTAAYNNLYALDAVSGKLRWHYEHPMPSDIRLCCGPANRGVGILGDKLYMATLDARLVALNRQSGEVVWNVVMDDYQAGYSATGAPLVIEDLVIIGSGGGEFAARGFIDAYDAQTGTRRWRRYTVPGAGEPGVETWAGESWRTGGAPAWVTGTYDPASKLLYWTTGNPSPLFNGDARAGDNLYSNSVLALEVATGAVRWHFQYTPHDVWDYDATNGLVLIDVVHAGKKVRALAQPNRNGYLYVLNAATGQYLRGAQYVEKLNWATGLDPNGRPLVDPKFYPTTEGLREFVCPGSLGGNNGSFTYAYSPRTRLMYVPIIESCLALIKERTDFKTGDVYLGGSLGDSDGTTGTSYGHLSALDPATGKIKWRYRDRYPLVGGALATGGGLIFTGNQEGYALALDEANGKVLWQFQTGSAVRSQPITFKIDGRQYVAIGSGAGGAAVTVVGEPVLRTLGSALVVFALAP
jgi:alcohol dehydrogenase (cytochrome c)